MGRRDGLRAGVRSRLGWLTWVDAPPRPVAAPPHERPGVPVRGAALPSSTRVAGADELRPGEVLEVFVGERSLALVRTAAGYHLLDGVCAHAGGPLADGSLDGDTLTCPWHGWSYDVRTGRSFVDPETCVRTFPVEVVDGAVYTPSDLAGRLL